MSSLYASNTSTQTISYTIPSSIELAVTGSPTLAFQAAAAGENFAPVVATAAYLLSCNKSNYKVNGKISALVPDVNISAQLVAPPGATSAGTVVLGMTDKVLVSGITKTKIQNGTITYTMAPSDPNVVPSDISGGTVTVTFTLSP